MAPVFNHLQSVLAPNQYTSPISLKVLPRNPKSEEVADPSGGKGEYFNCVGRKRGARSTASTGVCCVLLSVGTAGQTNTTTRT